jgi:hypothetical protein
MNYIPENPVFMIQDSQLVTWVLDPFFLNKKTLGLGHHILALPLTTVYGLPLPPKKREKKKTLGREELGKGND